MIKKIFFVIVMILASYYLSFIVMYNQTLDSINQIVNDAISDKDYDSILSYSDFYLDTPMYYFENEDFIVQVNNTYNEGLQSLTIIVIDNHKIQGEESLLEVTCIDTYSYNNIFIEYEQANIAVVTLYQGGESEYSLGEDCFLGKFENLFVKSNTGETIIALEDEIGFIDSQTILEASPGYTLEEIEEIQYPNGLVKPIILPLIGLWVSVLALIFIYRKFFKKK